MSSLPKGQCLSDYFILLTEPYFPFFVCFVIFFLNWTFNYYKVITLKTKFSPPPAFAVFNCWKLYSFICLVRLSQIIIANTVFLLDVVTEMSTSTIVFSSCFDRKVLEFRKLFQCFHTVFVSGPSLNSTRIVLCLGISPVWKPEGVFRSFLNMWLA